MTLQFHVANSLTGKIIGRLNPSEWSWTDPVTGQGEGSIKVAIPRDPDQVLHLADLTQPLVRQVVVRDELGRWWFGGPVIGDPEVSDDTLTIPLADWRAWFYNVVVTYNLSGFPSHLYIKEANHVDQCRVIQLLAVMAYGDHAVGRPRFVIDDEPVSGIYRDVTVKFLTPLGEGMDNVARRERGPDWWTYIADDPSDPESVVIHHRIAWPERRMSKSQIVLRHQVGKGGNLLGYTWPRGTAPTTRVFGTDNSPFPDEKAAIASDPAIAAGEALAWEEVYQVPDGVTTTAAMFEHALARLQAHNDTLGQVEVTIRTDATDLATWGPGDHARLIVSDGWRDVDLDNRRILSRTLSGRGGEITSVKATVNLSLVEFDVDDPPVEDTGEDL